MFSLPFESIWKNSIYIKSTYNIQIEKNLLRDEIRSMKGY